MTGTLTHRIIAALLGLDGAAPISDEEPRQFPRHAEFERELREALARAGLGPDEEDEALPEPAEGHPPTIPISLGLPAQVAAGTGEGTATRAPAGGAGRVVAPRWSEAAWPAQRAGAAFRVVGHLPGRRLRAGGDGPGTRRLPRRALPGPATGGRSARAAVPGGLKPVPDALRATPERRRPAGRLERSASAALPGRPPRGRWPCRTVRGPDSGVV